MMTMRPTKKGFTLVETMVAIAVLAIALVGPFTAVQNALHASYIARDELIASSLAQEGIEYIRSVRDDNYLNGRGWMSGLSSLGCYGTTPAKYCSIDPSRGDVNSFPQAMDDSYGTHVSVPLLAITSGGLYNQQTATPATRFRRSAQLKKISDTEVQVTVLVSWTTSNQSYSVTVVDTLQNWL